MVLRKLREKTKEVLEVAQMIIVTFWCSQKCSENSVYHLAHDIEYNHVWAAVLICKGSLASLAGNRTLDLQYDGRTLYHCTTTDSSYQWHQASTSVHLAGRSPQAGFEPRTSSLVYNRSTTAPPRAHLIDGIRLKQLF